MFMNNDQLFLCEAIKSPDAINKKLLTDLYKEIGNLKCFNLAKENDVVANVAYSLHDVCGIHLNKSWMNKKSELGKLINEYMHTLDNVALELNKSGIKVIALKNSGICRAIYKVPECSPMGDLDILISKKQFKKAHSILLNLGFNFEFRSELEINQFDKALMSGGTEYWKKLRSGNKLWLELQWRPIAGRWIRQDKEPKAEFLIENSLPITNSSIRILKAEYNLLQVVLHTAKHSYVRAPGFRLHTDVDRIVRNTKIDWDYFVKLVENINVKTASFFSLYLAHELLDTPIPKNVMISLKPSLIKFTFIRKELQRVGLFYPNDKKWNKFSYLFFVMLLYDTLSDLFYNIFPPLKFVNHELHIKKGLPTVKYYIHRIFNLAFKRKLV